MRSMIQERIDIAKDIHLLRATKNLGVDTEDIINEDNSILWMKSRWKQLYDIKVSKN